MLTVELPRLALQPGQWLLDLGCGEGRHVHGVQMLGGVNAAGLDMDMPSLEKALSGAESFRSQDAAAAFLIGDAYRLPFADGFFDAVICSEVLEHLLDYPAALREIARVLKPQGILAASVPHAWTERICWQLAPGKDGYGNQPGGHVRIFSEAELRGVTEAQGFRAFAKHYAHGLHMPYWWLKCALWQRRDDHPLVRRYHRLLVWDILERPRLTRVLDGVLTAIMPKSLVLYFRKEAAR